MNTILVVQARNCRGIGFRHACLNSSVSSPGRNTAHASQDPGRREKGGQEGGFMREEGRKERREGLGVGV